MAFDGTKETCPNRNSDNEIDMSYTYFVGDDDSKNDPSFGTRDFNRECFNICEAKPPGLPNRPAPTYIENGVCKLCPDPENDDSEGGASPPEDGSIQDLKNKGIYSMCYDSPEGSSEIGGIPIWFSEQQAANLEQIFVGDLDWVDASTNSRSPIRQFWKQATRGMNNEEIKRRLGRRRTGTTEYILPDKYMVNGEVDYETLRQDINEGRGSIIPCNEQTQPDWVSECVDGFFGPDHIIPEEVHDFWITLYGELDTGTPDRRAIQTFSELLSGISGDSTFEKCVNDRLNTGILNRDGDDDETIQSRIASYDNLAQFQNSDIHYLKRKLRRIVTIKTDEVNECMNLLNLGKSVCRTGVADKTLQIGRLIFSIIGNDRIDVLNMNNEEQIKLNKMIDELGPLIPQAVKNIIHVSKEYEARICNVPSNTTLLLERVYIDLYDKPTEINLDFSPYIDFNSLINIDDNVKFIKTIFVLVVFAYLLMHFSNIIVAFLSRGATVTKIT